MIDTVMGIYGPLLSMTSDQEKVRRHQVLVFELGNQILLPSHCAQ